MPVLNLRADRDLSGGIRDRNFEVFLDICFGYSDAVSFSKINLSGYEEYKSVTELMLEPRKNAARNHLARVHMLHERYRRRFFNAAVEDRVMGTFGQTGLRDRQNIILTVHSRDSSSSAYPLTCRPFSFTKSTVSPLLPSSGPPICFGVLPRTRLYVR